MSVRECPNLSASVSPAVRWGWLYTSLPGSYKLKISGRWPFWSQVSSPRKGIRVMGQGDKRDVFLLFWLLKKTEAGE